MASYRKRGDYQWQVRVSKKGYPSQSKTFESKPEAEKWAREIESLMDKGRFVSHVEADTTTLHDALNRYAELGADISLAIETAMRRSEIANLEWCNIDFNNRTAHLPDTKPGDSDDVPLSSKAITCLKAIPKCTIKDELTGKLPPDPKVFRIA